MLTSNTWAVKLSSPEGFFWGGERMLVGDSRECLGRRGTVRRMSGYYNWLYY